MLLLQREIDDAGAVVIVVACGNQEGGTRWLKETKCQYTMLLDQERKVCTTHVHKYISVLQKTVLTDRGSSCVFLCWILKIL